jgi:hypothetical protein
VASPTEARTPNLHRAKIAHTRVRMEGWRQRRLGGTEQTQGKKKAKVRLDISLLMGRLENRRIVSLTASAMWVSWARTGQFRNNNFTSTEAERMVHQADGQSDQVRSCLFFFQVPSYPGDAVLCLFAPICFGHL